VSTSWWVASNKLERATGVSGPTCRDYHAPVSTIDGGNPSQAVLVRRMNGSGQAARPSWGAVDVPRLVWR
jgi:hypothetical protein